MGSSMTLTQLRYFVSVARHKSLSRAARELNVSQPALNRQIKLLESELALKGINLTVQSVRAGLNYHF